MGRAADAGKFNIQPIKRFDCYLENHRFLPNSNKVCLTPFLTPFHETATLSTKFASFLQYSNFISISCLGPTLQFDVGGDLGDPVIFRNPT